MKILVVTRYIPRPDFSSGDRRLLAILKILAKSHQVTLCLPETGTTTAASIPGDPMAYVKNLGVTCLCGDPGGYERTLREEQYDAGFFEYFWMAEMYMGRFIRLQPRAAVIVDSVDLHFAREETHARLEPVTRWKKHNTRRRELLVYRVADITLAVSREDRDRMLTEDGIGQVCLVPNIVPSVPRTPGKRDPVLIFIGCYDWTPNVDAMTWFAEMIWPGVLRQHPDARMMMIGSNPPPEILALAAIPGIEVKGYVPDTAPYLDRAAISVAPLRYGGGMKGKVNEACAHGVPVVGTTIGAQGFGATSGTEMFISDDPAGFAACINRLLEDHDLQARMGLAGQALNERLCSPAVVATAIESVMALCSRVDRNKARPRRKRQLAMLALNRFMIKYHYRNLFTRSGG